jgi:uncharacterized membrane protein affecting hemolysin expression
MFGHVTATQTQEEVAVLQQKLSAAQQRVEEVRTSLNTEHIGATACLQQRNQELIAEVEEMQVSEGVGGVDANIKYCVC